MNIPNNIGSIFTGTYLHCIGVPKETMVNRNIEKRIKLRRGRFDEIERTERNINNELFKGYFTDYKSPSTLYKKLSKKKDAVNQVRVDSMKKNIK